MTRMEYQNEIDDCTMELRSLMEAVKDSSKDINLEEVKTRKAELEAKRMRLSKELAELDRPEERGHGALVTNEEFLKCATEKRTLTIGGIGKIEQVQQLFEAVDDKTDILNAITIDYGTNANTAIPVLDPLLEDPQEAEEGASGLAEDDEAEIIVTEIQPKAYVAILPVTAEALTMGSIDIESKLPELFRKAFRRKQHKALFNGVLTNSKGVKGLWAAAAENAAGKMKVTDKATNITVHELAHLALTAAGKDADYEIVMNSSIYSGILADPTPGKDVETYKADLIQNKMIEGIHVRIDNKASTGKTAEGAITDGSVAVVAAPLARYHLGIVPEIFIDPIKVKGDTKTYFQATCFFGGRQVTDSDVMSLCWQKSE